MFSLVGIQLTLTLTFVDDKMFFLGIVFISTYHWSFTYILVHFYLFTFKKISLKQLALWCLWMHRLFQLFQKHPQTAFKLHSFQGFWVRRNSNSAKQLRQISPINPFISWCKKKFLFFAARWLILSVRQLKPTMRLVFDNRKMWIFICKLSRKVRSKWSLETCGDAL